MSTVISVENLSKTYRLGQIGTGTFTHDLNMWWAKMSGKPNPMLRIGEKDHGNRDGEELWALKNITFKVEQGDVLGIIGRNGAGKSTLLKILSRVTAPTSGKIKVKGRIASLLEVGTGFHPELTGRENIYLNGAILGMSRKEIQSKFDEIVDFSEVEKFIDTPVKRYSSGMYVRLAFAVAAHLEPEILVIDEVLAVGDAEFQKKCLGKMGDVAKEGRTVLFVSHNMAAITSLCSRVIYLDKGFFMSDGNADEIVQLYLARNINNSGVNLAERTDRSGNGLARVNMISMADANGAALDIIISGQDVTVLVDYEIPAGVIIERGVCILVFKTQLGQPLFTCSTRLFDEYMRLAQHGRLLCYIPHFPLNQGSYYIDIYLKQGNHSHDVLDSVEQAIHIQVVVGDFFGTGRAANPESSPALVEHSWIGEEIK
jgi:lipopolysaccharide transport system ATP-binding protein